MNRRSFLTRLAAGLGLMRFAPDLLSTLSQPASEAVIPESLFFKDIPVKVLENCPENLIWMTQSFNLYVDNPRTMGVITGISEVK